MALFSKVVEVEEFNDAAMKKKEMDVFVVECHEEIITSVAEDVRELKKRRTRRKKIWGITGLLCPQGHFFSSKDLTYLM